MSYLEKLKALTSHLEELPKVPKGVEAENKATPPTAKSAQTPFDSFDSNPGRRFSGNDNQAIKSDHCPAQCQRSGYCFGLAFFEGRPDGRGRVCNSASCPWEKTKSKQED